MKKPFVKISVFVFFVAVLILVLNLPVLTRQGVDYRVASRSMPLYVKACAFIYRDFEYRDLARRITAGIDTDRAKVAAIYDWTVKNIREVPPGFPIVDDHIWNIVVRGYGAADQRTDVFTVLASYSGYEALWDSFRIRGPGGGLLTVAFVRLDDKWYAFDIYNNRKFIDLEDSSILAPDGLSYREHFRGMDKANPESRWQRSNNQKIFPRMVNELKKAF